VDHAEGHVGALQHVLALDRSVIIGQVPEDRDFVQYVELPEGHVRALQHVLAPDRSVNAE